MLLSPQTIPCSFQTNFDIKEQLKQYLQVEIKLLTTPCVIMECEKLGKKLYAATNMAKTFPVHKCGHETSPISGAHCLKSMLKGNHYIICSQDTDLQEWLRRRAGHPLIYLHGTAPVFEAPSNQSKEFISQKTLAMVESGSDKQRLLTKVTKELKKKVEEKKIMKKRAKGPNPLACKKKKKKGTPSQK